MSKGYPAEGRAISRLIYLSSAGARGESVTASGIDWKELLYHASAQHALTTVACALVRSPGLECPEAVKGKLLTHMRDMSSANLIRGQRMMRILKEMEEEGLRVRLLKGHVAAAHYAYPECRSSVDWDMLVDPSQEEAACLFLEGKGFQVSRRDKTSQHSICVHPRCGVIELHVSLYAELVGEVWFQGMNEAECLREAPVRVDGPDGSYTTLGYTDHLLFLILHMIKHFISSGLTIRMMLDIALFYSHNREKVDTARLWETLNRLHYAELVNNILWIMIRDGGFDPAEFPGISDDEPEQMELLLDDLEQGGYMGVMERDARYAGGMEYNRQLMLKSKSPMEYRRYMIGWKIRSAAKYMFPRRELLLKLYPNLEKQRWLTPFVRVYQMFGYPVYKLFSGALKKQILSDHSEMTEISRGRVELFRRMKMI